MILGMYLVQVHCHATEYFAKSHPNIATSLDHAQDHAAKFSSTPCTITHATESFATETPHPFFETLLLILRTLLHVLKMMAIESQKSILHTSDVADAKVITTGEPTMPSLLITALTSINDLFAGISRARNLL